MDTTGRKPVYDTTYTVLPSLLVPVLGPKPSRLSDFKMASLTAAFWRNLAYVYFALPGLRAESPHSRCRRSGRARCQGGRPTASHRHHAKPEKKIRLCQWKPPCCCLEARNFDNCASKQIGRPPCRIAARVGVPDRYLPPSPLLISLYIKVEHLKP